MIIDYCDAKKLYLWQMRFMYWFSGDSGKLVTKDTLFRKNQITRAFRFQSLWYTVIIWPNITSATCKCLFIVFKPVRREQVRISKNKNRSKMEKFILLIVAGYLAGNVACFTKYGGMCFIFLLIITYVSDRSFNWLI